MIDETSEKCLTPLQICATKQVMILHETQIRVRYVETDAMGHVHHSHYLNWFEVARIELMRSIGISYKEMEEAGYLLPVLQIEVKYMKPSYFDDLLVVKAKIAERPTVRVLIEYEVMRREDLLVTGKTLLGFINKKGRPTKPMPEFIEIVNACF